MAKTAKPAIPTFASIRSPKCKSLGVKTNRKSGGQPGYEGTTLQIKAIPDEIIDYMP